MLCGRLLSFSRSGFGLLSSVSQEMNPKEAMRRAEKVRMRRDMGECRVELLNVFEDDFVARLDFRDLGLFQA